MTKPKPAKPATPEPAPSQGSEPQPQDADNGTTNPNEHTGEEPPAATEPMETKMSESAPGAA